MMKELKRLPMRWDNMRRVKRRRWVIGGVAVLIIGLVVGRGLIPHPSPKAAPQVSASPPPAVVVTGAIARTVPIYNDEVAQTDAVNLIDLRAQVAGTLEQVLFKEGTEVKQGQTLFVIDRRPYEAALQSVRAQLSTAQANLTQALEQRQLTQAQAQLATAEANLQLALEQVNVRQAHAQLTALKATLVNAQQTVRRDKYLVAQGAVAQQQLDNDDATAQAAAANVDAQQAVLNDTALSQKIAIASAQASVLSAAAGVHDAALQTRTGIDTARAAVAQAGAAVAQAALNLEYTTIWAPVNGVIGVLQVHQGNWVQPNTLLDSMSSADPIEAKFHQSEVAFLGLLKRTTAEAAKAGLPPVNVPSFQLILADNSVYPHTGTFRTLNRAVDPQTGTILVEALFPNPERLLRPGMFARVRAKLEDRPNTVLVPQAAVQEVQGAKTVFIVGSDNKVSLRSITTGGPYGQFFIVLNGLQTGERVIVEGVQKVRPGIQVTPTLQPAPALPTSGLSPRGGDSAGTSGRTARRSRSC